MFRADGSVRTTDNWTDHGRQHPAAVNNINPNIPDILDAIRATSARHGEHVALAQVNLKPDDWHALYQALIEAESAYLPAAVSAKGAYGLGQLMPDTARALGVDRHDIAENLDGAARYLLAQLDTFRDIDLALAAYNAGPHRVIAYGGVPPFAETHKYIARIHRIRARLSGRPAISSNKVSEPLHRTAVVMGRN